MSASGMMGNRKNPFGVRHLQTADCRLADYISCYLYEYMLYIPIPLSIPILIPIPIYLYLYEALVWLTEVLVWLTQARVCKSAVCKCRTPESFTYCVKLLRCCFRLFRLEL